MLYLIDTANIEEIKKVFDLYPMSGVTTNPTIIAKENTNFLEILKDIRTTIGKDKMLHIQVISTKADEIIREAQYLNNIIGGNLYIKIPVIPEGIKAIKFLKKKGLKITATAIFTAQQALIAAAAGAEFVAPYINRIDNISGNGINVACQIIKLFTVHRYDTKVLAASFKNVQQIHEIALAGVHSITTNAELINNLVEHPMTAWSVNQFIKDWEKVYGKGKLTYNI